MQRPEIFQTRSPRLGRPTSALLLAVWLPVALAVMAGCQAIDFYDTSLERPAPPELEPARELAMRSLPAYRIEPPDILQIEQLKLVPLPPYRVEAYDVLRVDVYGTFLEQPINDFYLVEAEGILNLGPAYGSIRVVGMTIDQTKQAIQNHLAQYLNEPEVSVELGRASGTQPVTGTYLVGPDGTVNLRQYGAVRVAGLSVTEAKLSIEKQLSQYFDSPEVSVDVAGYNSKVYYIITEGAGMGDSLVRIPVTGNETVLDAISQIQGISQLSSKNIWIARPAPGGFGCEQILPVDWDGITRGATVSTNYQLMPGDRVFIAEDPLLALNNFIGRMIGPAERMLGFSSLGVATIRNFNSISFPTQGF